MLFEKQLTEKAMCKC